MNFICARQTRIAPSLGLRQNLDNLEVVVVVQTVSQKRMPVLFFKYSVKRTPIFIFGIQDRE